MSYYELLFWRLMVFVAVTCVFYVIGLSFMVSRFALPDWLFSFVFMSVVVAGIFILVFWASELCRKTVLRRFNTEARVVRDALIASFFVRLSWLSVCTKTRRLFFRQQHCSDY